MDLIGILVPILNQLMALVKEAEHSEFHPSININWQMEKKHEKMKQQVAGQSIVNMIGTIKMTMNLTALSKPSLMIKVKVMNPPLTKSAGLNLVERSREGRDQLRRGGTVVFRADLLKQLSMIRMVGGAVDLSVLLHNEVLSPRNLRIEERKMD